MPREDKETEEERRAKDSYDLIRMRLTRLEKNIDKLAPIPARRDAPKPKQPPEFILNVRGSTAAADSAEFHRIRNARRREQLRQDYMEKEGIEEDLKREWEERQQEIREEEEAKTAKKRAKRLKRKIKMKELKKKKKRTNNEASDEDEDESDTSEDEQQESTKEGTELTETPEDASEKFKNEQKEI